MDLMINHILYDVPIIYLITHTIQNNKISLKIFRKLVTFSLKLQFF